MRHVALRRALPFVFGAAVVPAAPAQRITVTAPAAPVADTFVRRLSMTRRFDARDGIEHVSVMHVARSRDGVLWVGTMTGPMHWEGTRFVRVPLPAPYDELPVRRLLIEGDAIWAGSPRGIFRLRRNRPWEHLLVVPPRGAERRTWSLVAWQRDARTRLVATSIEDSVLLLDAARGTRVGALTLPRGIDPFGTMLAVTSGPRGETLWGASLRAGLWRVEPGDSVPRFVALPGVAGATLHEDVRACPQLGPQGLVLATDVGAFALVEGRAPRRIGDARNVIRVACAGRPGAEEFWVGTRDGTLQRVRADGVTRVTLLPGPSAVSLLALEIVDVDDADPAVFVSRVSGGLWRGRANGIAMLELPAPIAFLSYSAIMEQPRPDGSRRVLVSSDGHPTFDLAHRADPLARTPTQFSNYLRLRDSSVVGITWSGLQRLGHRGGWVAIPTTQGRYLLTATRIARPGSESIVASFRERLEHVPLDGGPLVPVTPAVGGGIERLAHDSVGDILWAARRDTIFRIHFRTARVDTLAARDGLPHGPFLFTRVGHLTDGRRVAVVGARGGVAIADASLDRPRFVTWDTTSLPGLGAIPVTSSALLPDGRLVLGTAAGVGIWQLDRDLARTPHALAWFDMEDGLDDGMVHRVMPSPDRTRLWLATGQGIAEMPLLAQRTPTAPGRLSVRLTGADGRRPVRDGAVLPWSERTLLVRARLVNLRHESGTRYAVVLRGGNEGDSVPTWHRDGDRTFASLSDGDYVLTVRARDWLGREASPQHLHFTVLPPWWRAPATVSLTGLLGLGGAAVAFRARTRRLRRRAAEAEAAAARIRDSEERFRLLFERGADAQLLLEQRTIVGANPAALALLGEPRVDLLVGRALESVLDAPPLRDGEDVEGTACAVDGTRIPVVVRRTEIPLGRGTVEHLELHDLRETQRLATERRELEQQLMASQRLESLGTLAGGVAHDFNNLLTIIRMNTELADEAVGDGSTADAREALASVLQASDRARDIVRQILTFSRRTPPARQALRLAALVEGARPLLRATLPATVALELEDTAGDAGWIAGDATQLQQLLLNLASNAEHAMRGRGGTLRIATDVAAIGAGAPAVFRALAPGAYVRLLVTDTGCGMSSATVARVFEPFFTTKPVGEGTGLGLAVLHGIVAAHGGAVHVQSAVGAGTRFEIVFPAIPAPASVPGGAATAAAPARPVGTRGTVLLVDDEPALRRIAERALGDAGFTVHTASDAKAALAHLEATAGGVSCLVTDQTMPGMTGDALAEVVAASWPAVPIVIASGFSARIAPDALRRARVVAVLEKPYDRSQLVAVVARAITARETTAGTPA